LVLPIFITPSANYLVTVKQLSRENLKFFESLRLMAVPISILVSVARFRVADGRCVRVSVPGGARPFPPPVHGRTTTFFAKRVRACPQTRF